jgi:hypothetical protein
MPKQRYELEIEEILRSCEESAMREELYPGKQDTQRSPFTRDEAAFATMTAPVESRTVEEHAPPQVSRLPSGSQLALFVSVALLAGLIFMYFGIFDVVSLVSFLVLTVAAICVFPLRKE